MYRDILSTTRETVMSRGYSEYHQRDSDAYRDTLSTIKQNVMWLWIDLGPPKRL